MRSTAIPPSLLGSVLTRVFERPSDYMRGRMCQEGSIPKAMAIVYLTHPTGIAGQKGV